MNSIKKLLLSLMSFSSVVVTSSSIISCESPIDNSYNKYSDIDRLWNFKSFKTISIDKLGLNSQNAPEKKEDGSVGTNLLVLELIKLIGFRFNNFDSNELKQNQESDVFKLFNEKISFQIYLRNSEDSLIIDTKNSSKNNLNDLTKILDDEFINGNNGVTTNRSEVKLYFKYTIGDNEYVNNNFLDFKITNKPIFAYEFKDSPLTTDLSKEIDWEKQTKFRKLSGLIDKNKKYIIKIDEVYQDSFSLFTKVKNWSNSEDFENTIGSIALDVVNGFFNSFYKRFSFNDDYFENFLDIKLIKNSKGEYVESIQLFTPKSYLYYLVLKKEEVFQKLKSIANLNSSNKVDIKNIFGSENIDFV
ncbi:hypothetical protein SLITO_v1c04860 [Spiroplasma litorale]|uniref:Lipoprotein n=1 Tax=Spiroplasma litorale TaxID=216942 RepID=A0A0K1W1D8_9MOLU|nr:hypothetical protein [Spiroplasma litorale]AKX34139.1 hypothetical protein SLITO_v1c04860 [Spiroplasma litorale]